MKEPTLTNEQYVAKGGNACPFCESRDISAGPFDVDGRTAFQDVHCNNCQHNWQDTYRLEGYTTEFSEQPEEEET